VARRVGADTGDERGTRALARRGDRLVQTLAAGAGVRAAGGDRLTGTGQPRRLQGEVEVHAADDHHVDPLAVHGRMLAGPAEGWSERRYPGADRGLQSPKVTCGAASQGDEMFQKIVVGTDGSDGATVALNTAIELAQATGAELHVVSAMK